MKSTAFVFLMVACASLSFGSGAVSTNGDSDLFGADPSCNGSVVEFVDCGTSTDQGDIDNVVWCEGRNFPNLVENPLFGNAIYGLDHNCGDQICTGRDIRHPLFDPPLTPGAPQLATHCELTTGPGGGF